MLSIKTWNNLYWWEQKSYEVIFVLMATHATCSFHLTQETFISHLSNSISRQTAQLVVKNWHYWNIPEFNQEKRSRELMASAALCSCYYYKVILFGLMYSSTIFQCILTTVLMNCNDLSVVWCDTISNNVHEWLCLWF